MLASVSEEMIEAGLQYYSEGGCSGLADYERREVVKDILTAGMEVFGSITPDERSEYWRGAYDRMAARSIEDGAKIAKLETENERLRKALEWALDRATDSDHPHYPARGESWPWVYPYLVSGTPYGGGVGEAGFSSALEAVEAAMVETRS